MMKAIPKIDFARLAAYIDGEGSIWISTYRYRNPETGKIYEGFRMEITLGNTDPRLALWTRKTFGGWLSMERIKGGKYRPIFKWRIAALKARTILEKCMPYFVIKAKEASVAIAFQKTMSKANARPGVPKETLIQRHRLRAELKNLKHLDHGIPSAFIN